MSINNNAVIFIFFTSTFMTSPIKKAFLELKDIVNKNPQSLGVYEKLNELTRLVHAQILENIKRLSGKSWQNLGPYSLFQNNAHERAQMEKNVLYEEIGINISILEINQQISMAMMTAMTDAPNIFSTEVGKTKGNESQTIEALIQSQEPLNTQEALEEGSQGLNLDYLRKNKEIILRLVRDKRTKWLALRKNADFTTFYIEFEGKKVPYSQIAELYLGKGVLNTHDNMLRVHVRLTEQIFDEESIEKRYNSFKDAIKQKGNWLDLENAEELRNNYVVSIGGNNYTYRNLIAIFGAYVKNSTLLSLEVYKELSTALFGKTWKHSLKSVNSSVNQTSPRQRKNTNEEVIDFEDEQSLRNLLNNQNSPKKVEVKIVENFDEETEIEEGISIEEVMVVRGKKPEKKLAKELEYENNRRMVVALAYGAMDQNPELKKLWFGTSYSEEGPRLFRFEYEGEELSLRKIAELTGLYGINRRIPFPKFIEQLFGKEIVEIMRAEIQEEEKKKIALEKKNTENGEKLNSQSQDSNEQKKESLNNADKNSLQVETPKENPKEEKSKRLFKKLEDAGIFDGSGVNYKKILLAFDKVVEECIIADKENIDNRINELIKKEWGSISSECRKRYPKADPTIKNIIKNVRFIEECKTEFLLSKQDELRMKIMKFISDGNITQSRNFYWGLVKGLENVDFALEFSDYIIDSVENKFKESHQQDEKGTLDELKAQDQEYQKGLREKEIEEYCKKNELTRPQYNAFLYLIRNLKRKKNGQDMEKYLYKLKKRNEALRGEEFDNDFTDELVNALTIFGISLATKDTPKKRK